MVTKGGPEYKVFHCLANSHRRFNTIGQLYVDGALTADQETIKVHIVNFYQISYKKSGAHKPLLDGLDFSSLDAEDVEWLERPFDDYA